MATQDRLKELIDIASEITRRAWKLLESKQSDKHLVRYLLFQQLSTAAVTALSAPRGNVPPLELRDAISAVRKSCHDVLFPQRWTAPRDLTRLAERASGGWDGGPERGRDAIANDIAHQQEVWFCDSILEPARVARNRLFDLWQLTLASDKRPANPKSSDRGLKGETPTETKIIGALKLMLQNQGKDAPPQGKEIAKLAKVSANSVKNFLKGKLCGSQVKFEAAWRRGYVREKLALLEYGPPKKHLEFDDSRPVSTKGVHHRGQTPGSGGHESNAD